MNLVVENATPLIFSKGYEGWAAELPQHHRNCREGLLMRSKPTSAVASGALKIDGVRFP